MASSDSSLWLGMNSGHTVIETRGGDEPLDGINAVSTGLKGPMMVTEQDERTGEKIC
jgi:hypothetical protein